MDIIAKHYKDVVAKTWNYNGKCKTKRDHILNAVLGIGGEAGEVVDIHKKMLFHKARDGRKKELLLELGDLYYYMSVLQNIYGFTTEEILKANKEKLFERYEVETK